MLNNQKKKEKKRKEKERKEKQEKEEKKEKETLHRWMIKRINQRKKEDALILNDK